MAFSSGRTAYCASVCNSRGCGAMGHTSGVFSGNKERRLAVPDRSAVAPAMADPTGLHHDAGCRRRGDWLARPAPRGESRHSHSGWNGHGAIGVSRNPWQAPIREFHQAAGRSRR